MHSCRYQSSKKCTCAREWIADGTHWYLTGWAEFEQIFCRVSYTFISSWQPATKKLSPAANWFLPQPIHPHRARRGRRVCIRRLPHTSCFRGRCHLFLAGRYMFYQAFIKRVTVEIRLSCCECRCDTCSASSKQAVWVKWCCCLLIMWAKWCQIN